MSGLHAFWNDVWPNLAAAALTLPAAFTWHHWKVRTQLTRHMLRVTAVLNDHLEIMAGVGDTAGDKEAGS